MILIFIMSSFSSQTSSNQSGFITNMISYIFKINSLDNLNFIIRKIAHFTEYYILGILVYNMIKHHNKERYYSSLICIIYSISDELHQILVPGRNFQITDITIDILGATLGIYTLIYFYKISKRRFK